MTISTTEKSSASPSQEYEEEEEEEDYMTMAIPDTTTTTTSSTSKTETSLQRHARIKRENELKARVKSKAELAAEEKQRREEGLSTSLLDDRERKGMKLMGKLGFKGGALGKKQGDETKEDGEGEDYGNDENGELADLSGEHARHEPVSITMRENRIGIGHDTPKKRKVEEEAEERSKRAKSHEEDFVQRVRRENAEKRMEKQVWAGMKVAEGLDEADFAGKEREIGEVPVVYRNLARKRKEKERRDDRRGELGRALPSKFARFEDKELDDDDRIALGEEPERLREVESYAGSGEDQGEEKTSEILEDEDPELAEFNELPVKKRLERLVLWMRESHQYCFWCKMKYPDKSMEECPGITEEEHD